MWKVRASANQTDTTTAIAMLLGCKPMQYMYWVMHYVSIDIVLSECGMKLFCEVFEAVVH